MLIPPSPSRIAALSLALATLTLSQATAALLVYEGFDGYTGSSMSGKAPNANTIGLNQSVAYGGSTIANVDLEASGLSFANIASSGQAIGVDSGTGVIAGTIEIPGAPTAYVGTLWGSYLVRFRSAPSTGDSNGGGMRVSNDAAAAGERFLTYADSRTNGSSSLVVGYDSTVAGPVLPSVPATAGINTTYLMLSRFTGVGTTGGGTTSIGDADMWVFTEAQYASFLMAGGTEGVLDGLPDSAFYSHPQDTGTTVGPFQDGNFAHFLSVGNNVIYDEMRWGDSLASVTPIPEPTTGALALLGLVALLRCRGRGSRQE